MYTVRRPPASQPPLIEMSQRALIVDDSRSARVLLSRILEGYELAVEFVAEPAGS